MMVYDNININTLSKCPKFKIFQNCVSRTTYPKTFLAETSKYIKDFLEMYSF